MSTQKFDDAQGPAICIVFHIFLCSSSLWDPRHRLPKGVIDQALSREDVWVQTISSMASPAKSRPQI
ncbi:hypothetical protein ACHAWX_000183 [Stephanocyclus meneghinianus]